MGQQGSKSAIEARVVFQRTGTDPAGIKMDNSPSPTSVRIQKRVDCRSASPNFSNPEKRWSQCRNDAEGLEYVMDNPTGGVWVKSKERWTRS